MPNDQAKIEINMPPEYVEEGIPFTDRATGERRTFNAVTLPEGCRLGGEDVSGWEFSPKFVNPSRKRSGWKHIPLLADREVRLSHSTVDEAGRFVRDGNGRRVKEFMEVDPRDLARAISEVVGLL